MGIFHNDDDIRPFKRCPICTSSNRRFVVNSDRPNREQLFFIKCDDCLLQGPQCTEEQDAIIEWNRLTVFHYDVSQRDINE